MSAWTWIGLAYGAGNAAMLGIILRARWGQLSPKGWRIRWGLGRGLTWPGLIMGLGLLAFAGSALFAWAIAATLWDKWRDRHKSETQRAEEESLRLLASVQEGFRRSKAREGRP